MQFKRQHMRDAYTFWTAHAIPPVAKLDLPSCQWKRQHVILLLVQRVLVFVTSDSFSFFFLFSLLPKRYMLVLFVFGISISVLIILIYNVFLGPFIKILFVLNLVLQLQFVIYHLFQFNLYSYDF
jgi:hypothetical protein